MVMMVASADSTRGTQFRRGKRIFTSEPFHVYLVERGVLHRAPKPIPGEPPRHLVRYLLNGTVQQLLDEIKCRRKSGLKEYVELNLLPALETKLPIQLELFGPKKRRRLNEVASLT